MKGRVYVINAADSGLQGRGACRYVAVDGTTGQVAWWSEIPGQQRGTYYSCPVIAVINGERLMITGAADGAVHAFQVRTGKLVWSHLITAQVVNSSPVVDGNLVYISHGEENLDVGDQGRIVCLDASQVTKGEP